MSELYSLDILRLAAASIATPRLEAPSVTIELRSPTCGSRIIVDVECDAQGRVLRYGHQVNACALGQAAAAIVAREAVGRSVEAFDAVRHDLAAFLNDESDRLPDWPGIDVLARARPHRGRHASVLLPFRAVADAARRVIV